MVLFSDELFTSFYLREEPKYKNRNKVSHQWRLRFDSLIWLEETKLADKKVTAGLVETKLADVISRDFLYDTLVSTRSSSNLALVLKSFMPQWNFIFYNYYLHKTERHNVLSSNSLKRFAKVCVCILIIDQCLSN